MFTSGISYLKHISFHFISQSLEILLHVDLTMELHSVSLPPAGGHRVPQPRSVRNSSHLALKLAPALRFWYNSLFIFFLSSEKHVYSDAGHPEPQQSEVSARPDGVRLGHDGICRSQRCFLLSTGQVMTSFVI